MANITAADVNKLRQMTGAGMMDCKNALKENDGDFELAIEFLRKKGQKLANKRADRDANEGIVIAKTNAANTYGAVLMLNCETDFVGKNDEFVNFANSILDLAIQKGAKSLDELKTLELDGHTVMESVTEMIGKTGEKMDISHFEVIEAPMVFAYNHHGNRLSTLLGLNKADVPEIKTLGHEIAMQVAAMAPLAVDKDDVDAETIQKEIEIGKDVARQEGKPEEMLEKIAMGKLNKFYKENTLLNQESIKDNKTTVREMLVKADKGLTVTGFRRLMLGA
ncbi:MAG: translation elongation factor Ts [Bacillota bacterium]|nr:translation elongation factor Ts [Bacillota bacterium]